MNFYNILKYTAIGLSLIPFSSGISFTQHLLSQLKPISLNEKKMKIAEFLVGSIDESGYIRLEIEEIIDDLAFTQNLIVHEDELKEILNIVQDFDPPGVGALSLQGIFVTNSSLFTVLTTSVLRLMAVLTACVSELIRNLS